MSFSAPINFSFNSEEIKIIRSALGQTPYDDVESIIAKIYDTIKKEMLAKQIERTKQEPEAPYGYKADGTPRKRPGRPMKKARK